MAEQRYKTVNITEETHQRLSQLAAKNYRSIPAMISYLVDRELGAQELTDARQAVRSCSESSK